MSLRLLVSVLHFLLCLIAPALARSSGIGPILFVQDGGIEDYTSFLMLHCAPYHMLADIMTNADSVLPWSMQIAGKLHRIQLSHGVSTPLALSSARADNPFPWVYRGDTVTIANISAIQGIAPTVDPPYPDGDAAIVTALEGRSNSSVTLVLTTSATPLYIALKDRPDLRAVVRRVVWMAGAVDVPGNLDPKQFNNAPWNAFAEWNVFCDPSAAAWLLLDSGIAIDLVPLDVSDSTPVSAHFLAALKGAASAPNAPPTAAFLYHAYATVYGQPYYKLWDSTAAAVAIAPELFAPPSTAPITIVTGYNQTGRTARQGATDMPPPPPSGWRYQNVSLWQKFLPGGIEAFQKLIVHAASQECFPASS